MQKQDRLFAAVQPGYPKNAKMPGNWPQNFFWVALLSRNRDRQVCKNVQLDCNFDT
jgi:hypothetical protein